MIAATRNIETDYFAQIEAAFSQKRGKLVTLNSFDFQLMTSWQTRGVPVQIALRGIESAFKSAKNGEISTLRYCEKAVDAAFRDWQTAQTGAHAALPKADVVEFPAQTVDESAQVGAILKDLIVRLTEFYQALQQAELQRSNLIETVHHIGKNLRKMEGARAKHKNFVSIERALAELHAQLADALVANLTGDEQTELAAPIRAALVKFKARWTPETYRKTFDFNFARAARKHFAAPEITLFNTEL